MSPAQASLLLATGIYLSFGGEIQGRIDGEEEQEQTKRDRKGLRGSGYPEKPVEGREREGGK